MSRDRRALDIMDATGCRYMVALAQVRRRKDDGTLAAYLAAVERILAADDKGPLARKTRCVLCLRDESGAHACPGEPS